MRKFLALCLIVGCLAVTSLAAQNSPADSGSAQSDNAGTLKFVLILSRHGVRPPTWTNARLDAYSVEPWPAWSVPPGYLTGHGFELMKRFGGYDRALLAQQGLLSAKGCEDAAQTYIWADTDERTVESGRALAEGLFPGCPMVVHGHDAGQNDPLFHPRHDAKEHDAAAMTDVNATAKQLPNAGQKELIEQMQNVLLGCSATGACNPAHEPATMLQDVHALATPDTSDRTAEQQKSLSLAASFSEDFLLEYLEGMPKAQVGWGHVDENQLRKFLELHTAHAALTHSIPSVARNEASNMLFHITRTLEQAVEQTPLTDAVGPAESKLVVLVGHDTNIAAVAALLGLHWTLDGRADDTPPGAELQFELWQDHRGVWSVHIGVAMQTLHQMREMQDLTLAAPPARETLALQGGSLRQQTCSWQDFRSIADSAIDRNAVFH